MPTPYGMDCSHQREERPPILTSEDELSTHLDSSTIDGISIHIFAHGDDLPPTQFPPKTQNPDDIEQVETFDTESFSSGAESSTPDIESQNDTEDNFADVSSLDTSLLLGEVMVSSTDGEASFPGTLLTPSLDTPSETTPEEDKDESFRLDVVQTLRSYLPWLDKGGKGRSHRKGAKGGENKGNDTSREAIDVSEDLEDGALSIWHRLSMPRIERAFEYVGGCRTGDSNSDTKPCQQNPFGTSLDCQNYRGEHAVAGIPSIRPRTQMQALADEDSSNLSPFSPLGSVGVSFVGQRLSDMSTLEADTIGNSGSNGRVPRHAAAAAAVAIAAAPPMLFIPSDRSHPSKITVNVVPSADVEVCDETPNSESLREVASPMSIKKKAKHQGIVQVRSSYRSTRCICLFLFLVTLMCVVGFGLSRLSRHKKVRVESSVNGTAPTRSPTVNIDLPTGGPPTYFPTTAPISPTNTLSPTGSLSDSPTESTSIPSGAPAPTPDPTLAPTSPLAVPSNAPSDSKEEDAPLPPLPTYRFVPWINISESFRDIASQSLRYNESSWDVMGRNVEIESASFGFIRVNLNPTVISGVARLGFRASTWDCWVNHYQNYSWSELQDVASRTEFILPINGTEIEEVVYGKDAVSAMIVLGWNEDSWDHEKENRIQYFFGQPQANGSAGSEEAERRPAWDLLSAEEQNAATSICFTRELWDATPLAEWDT